ncbi:alanine--tRNA ligase [Streptomyces laurentii]|uniref:Alanine--tRNA ligase n=1 Tax=Streptomyces laurentii TaxID=39478 RepID=A0A160NWC2_STRLU|nr:alanine--tRNA ligase [Streptomyces laurentii]
MVLAHEHAGKAVLVAAITPDLLDRGPAARLIARAAKTVGGGGGGTGTIASAGGRHPEYLDEALLVAAGDAEGLLNSR